MDAANDTTVVIRISQELKRELQTEAERLDISLSEVVRTKLLTAQSAVHREPTIRLGDRSYRLWDILRSDVLEYDIVRTDASAPERPSTLMQESGVNESPFGVAYSDMITLSLIAARDHAKELASDEITPVHLLLGLFQLSDSNAMRVVRTIEEDVDRMVKVLRDHAAPAKRLIRRGDALALSKSAEKRLRMLATEARAEQMELADSVHLLLALLTTRADDAHPGISALADLGITYDRVRRAGRRMRE